VSDVEDIVSDWLKANGYDGLWSDGDCACLVGDLAPCNIDGGIPRDCTAGYKAPCTDTCDHEEVGDWHIQTAKPEGRP
jgi:hypothetical protein